MVTQLQPSDSWLFVTCEDYQNKITSLIAHFFPSLCLLFQDFSQMCESNFECKLFQFVEWINVTWQKLTCLTTAAVYEEWLISFTGLFRFHLSSDRHSRTTHNPAGVRGMKYLLWKVFAMHLLGIINFWKQKVCTLHLHNQLSIAEQSCCLFGTDGFL